MYLDSDTVFIILALNTTTIDLERIVWLIWNWDQNFETNIHGLVWCLILSFYVTVPNYTHVHYN